jgi:hypothetical protein
MGVRSSPSGGATCLSCFARLRVDVCVCRRIARGYRDDDCAQPGSRAHDHAALATATGLAVATSASGPGVRAPAAAPAAATSAGRVFQAARQAAPSARRPPALEGEEEDGGGACRDEDRTASPA